MQRWHFVVVISIQSGDPTGSSNNNGEIAIAIHQKPMSGIDVR